MAPRPAPQSRNGPRACFFAFFVTVGLHDTFGVLVKLHASTQVELLRRRRGFGLGGLRLGLDLRTTNVTLLRLGLSQSLGRLSRLQFLRVRLLLNLVNLLSLTPLDSDLLRLLLNLRPLDSDLLRLLGLRLRLLNRDTLAVELGLDALRL